MSEQDTQKDSNQVVSSYEFTRCKTLEVSGKGLDALAKTCSNLFDNNDIAVDSTLPALTYDEQTLLENNLSLDALNTMNAMQLDTDESEFEITTDTPLLSYQDALFPINTLATKHESSIVTSFEGTYNDFIMNDDRMLNNETFSLSNSMVKSDDVGISQDTIDRMFTNKDTIANPSVVKKDSILKSLSPFNENQGKISKLTTIVGKSTQLAGKVGSKTVRLSRKVQRFSEKPDKSNFDYLKDEGKHAIGRFVWKHVFKKFVSALIKKLMIALLAMIIFTMPLMIALVGAVSVLSIFGGGDETIVESYESYMNDIQQGYDEDVEAWSEAHPDGIVMGINGGYGRIDWKMPLAILQGLSGGLSLDSAEKDLINAFKASGLLEKHEEFTDEVNIINEDGEEETIEYTYLTITNPGYDQYLSIQSTYFSHINNFKRSKKLSPTDLNEFTTDELESINTLYQSEMFFSLFSESFQDYETSTGSNASETNFDSQEYNALNPFARSGYKGQCTWFVYGRALKVTGKTMPTGNANAWLQNAIALGYPTGRFPSKNAVIVLAGNNFGHVAFIEAWDGTKITVSEGNINNPCNRTGSQCNAVSYANAHYKELIQEKTYDSFDEYRAAQSSQGLMVIGFIYTE